MSDLTRRGFLQGSAAATAGAMVVGGLGGKAQAGEFDARAGEFASAWQAAPDRIWPGPEYWTNPLQDWRVANGRLECVNPAAGRNVHLLTRDLGEKKSGDLRMSVEVGRVDGDLDDGKGSVGFSIGVRGRFPDYRQNLIYGNGLDAGLTADGRLFIGRIPAKSQATISSMPEKAILELEAEPNRKGSAYRVSLTVRDPESGQELARIERENVPAKRLVGNLALAANFRSGVSRRGRRGGGGNPAGTGRFWFSDWQVEGSKVDAHEDRAFGPILFNQYTLSNGVMTMTAQMPPVGQEDTQVVRLQLQRDGKWQDVGQSAIDLQSRIVRFRLPRWDATRDVPYRLVYDFRATKEKTIPCEWTGTIRKDPVDKEELYVADICCNGHQAFPNAEYVEGVRKLNPDLIAFVGDQFYESSGGFGVVREPVDEAIVDYLRKWYLHGWTWRELMRDRPSIALPDDHDVYQGNLWGEGGSDQETSQEAGGYRMDPKWVNVVHTTQTSHHPAPYDPEPGKQGITVYYGPLTYGRVSFAILSDRQFKTGPEGVAPPTGSRPDHVKDPDFDPESADVPGAKLLGERQLEFLREWITDWRGADLKSVISQTTFTAMATHHGRQHMRLFADYDTNGWPQTARNRALRIIRKAFPFHIAGDQHMPAVVHYGIDEHGDAPVAVAGPPINTTYPRWWEPEEPGKNRPEGAPANTGEFIDHFGHPMTVLAVHNGEVDPERGDIKRLMDEKASGLAMVRFNKKKQTTTVECWPYLADPAEAQMQWAGWPVTVPMLANYGRKAVAYLPTFVFQSPKRPVLEVRDAAKETVYVLRVGEKSFQPHVFVEGTYTVVVSDPDSGRSQVFDDLEARAENGERIEVTLPS